MGLEMEPELGPCGQCWEGDMGSVLGAWQRGCALNLGSRSSRKQGEKKLLGMGSSMGVQGIRMSLEQTRVVLCI